MDKNNHFEDLIHILEVLRGEKGCPWDREQTHASLKNCMVEEAYEVCEAIDRAENGQGYENLCEELGDVLFQVVMHSQIAKEEEKFTINDVLNDICKKMVRRHPHVFDEDGKVREDHINGDKKSIQKDEILEQWDEIKKKEKQKKTIEEILSDIPNSFPALIRTQKVLEKVGKENVYNLNYEKIKKKLLESLETLDLSVKMQENDQLNENLGEMLFQLVNMAWFLQLNAENSLTNATNKFINRHIDVEHLAKAKGVHLRELITNR